MGDAGKDASTKRKGLWLRLLLFTLIFVIAPLGLYFVVYVEGRLQQTTVRNFNALDGAAEYLTLLVDNLPKVASNIPLGEPDRTAQALSASTQGAVSQEVAQDFSNVLKKWGALPQVDATDPTPCGDDDLQAWGAITDIARVYLEDLRSLASFREVQLALLDRTSEALATSGPSGCADQILARADQITVDACEGGGITRRLVGSGRGVRIQLQDCRALEERSPAVYNALRAAGDADTRATPTEIQVLLDHFGVRLTLPLEDLANGIADNVAPLFDQFLIADREGNVLYTAGLESAAQQPTVTGAPSSRATPLDFVSHVDVRALVLPEVRRGVSAQEALWRRVGAASEGAAGGRELATFGLHSRVESFRVGDVGFQAFVHPFAIHGLENRLLQGKSEAQGGLAEPIFMIGIVSQDRLSSESLLLPLALVSDSLLLLGVLFSTSAFLWLWTSGNRLMLGRTHAALLIVSALTTAVLYTLFSMQLITRSIDARALDQSVRAVHSSVRRDFAEELHEHLEALGDATSKMLQAGEAPARLAIEASLGENLGDRVKARYYCRPPGERPWPGSERQEHFPVFELAFLLDTQGTQWQCQSYRRFDTPPLSLAFRDYFRRPAQDTLWDVHREAPSQADARVWPDDPPGFFLNRITSVLDGTTETVLSARPDTLCGLVAEPGGGAAQEDICPSVASVDASVFISRMHALEEAITPPHVRLAVVETATGRTLFHSVGGRSLATNFYRETGGDESLLALVKSGTAGFVPLDYHGSRVRAFVSPLYPDVPWTLITYRGHELEDTIGITAVSLTTLMLLVETGGFLLISPLLIAFLWCVHRYRRARALPSIRWFSRLCGAWRRLLVAAVLTGVSLMAVAIAAPRGWPLFTPLLGALVAVVVVCLPGKLALRHAIDPMKAQARRTGWRLAPVVAFSMFVLLVGVFPAVGGMLHFRAMLAYDLADYLRGNVADTVATKCARHRAYAERYKAPYDRTEVEAPWQGVFAYGWHLVGGSSDDDAQAPASALSGELAPCEAFAGAAGRMAQMDEVLGYDASGLRSEGEARALQPRSLTYEPYQRIASFSPLAGELLAQRGDRVIINRSYRAPREVLRAIAPPLERLTLLEHVATLKVIQFLLVIAFGMFLTTFVVLSLIHRFLAATQQVPVLAAVAPDYVPRSWRERPTQAVQACVVHRSLALCRIFPATRRRTLR